MSALAPARAVDAAYQAVELAGMNLDAYGQDAVASAAYGRALAAYEDMAGVAYPERPATPARPVTTYRDVMGRKHARIEHPAGNVLITRQTPGHDVWVAWLADTGAILTRTSFRSAVRRARMHIASL